MGYLIDKGGHKISVNLSYQLHDKSFLNVFG